MANRELKMRAMSAVEFGGYQGLKLVDLPRPQASDGKVLVRVTAAGVTPLDHTILAGHFPLAKAPLVLGNEGAGVIVEGGDSSYPNGTRVMFTGPYGVFENGTYSEFVAVKKEHLCAIPDRIDDVAAGTMPVAYLTAYMTLMSAGFAPGKSVLAPAIGGSIGNAVTQLARAMGAKYAVSSTTSHEKAISAKALGYEQVIDLSQEKLSDGVMRITEGYGADIIIDAIGGNILSEALGTLAAGGSLTTLGYAADRQSTIDLTHLIWKGTSIKSFLLFSEPLSRWDEAWKAIVPLLKHGQVKPVVAREFPLELAGEALKHLVDDRPFGRVALKL